MIKEVLVKSLKKTALELLLKHLEKDDVKREDVEKENEENKCKYEDQATVGETFENQFKTWYQKVEEIASQDLKDKLNNLKDESGNPTTLLDMIKKLDEEETMTISNTIVSENGLLQYCNEDIPKQLYREDRPKPGRAESYSADKVTPEKAELYLIGKIGEEEYSRLFIELSLNRGYFEYKNQNIELWKSKENAAADADATGIVSQKQNQKKGVVQKITSATGDVFKEAGKKIANWFKNLFKKD
jgi:hypothetical protein